MLRSLSWCWCSGKKYFFSSLREIPWYSSWVLAPTNDSILLQSEIIDDLHGTGKLTRISLFTIVLLTSADTEAFPDPKLDLHHHGLRWATILCIFHFTWSRNNWSAWVCDLQKKRWRWLESWCVKMLKEGECWRDWSVEMVIMVLMAVGSTNNKMNLSYYWPTFNMIHPCQELILSRGCIRRRSLVLNENPFILCGQILMDSYLKRSQTSSWPE